jgi:hypothetical protein
MTGRWPILHLKTQLETLTASQEVPGRLIEGPWEEATIDKPSARCSKCSGPRDLGTQRYCKKCRREYQRDYQAGRREVLRRVKRSGLWF